MTSRSVFYLCLIGAMLLGQSASLPSFIKPCQFSDSGLNACVTRQIESAIPHFVKGEPQHGVRAMDPIAVGSIRVENAGLTVVMDDTVVAGVKTVRLNSAKFNTNKDKLTLDINCNLTISCNYKMDGQILILPINGEGPAKIKARNVHIVIKLYLDEEKDTAGVNHWNITKHKFTFKLGNVHFKLDNLFGGKNPELANAANQFMNENWEGVANELAPPVVSKMIDAAVQIVREFFLSEPLDNLIIR